MSFTTTYFNLGYQLQKQAGQDLAAALGASGPIGAALGAKKGREWDTIKGQLAGLGIGSLSGGALAALGMGGYSALTGEGVDDIAPAGLTTGMILGGMLGGGIGAYKGHGPDRK